MTKTKINLYLTLYEKFKTINRLSVFTNEFSDVTDFFHLLFLTRLNLNWFDLANYWIFSFLFLSFCFFFSFAGYNDYIFTLCAITKKYIEEKKRRIFYLSFASFWIQNKTFPSINTHLGFKKLMRRVKRARRFATFVDESFGCPFSSIFRQFLFRPRDNRITAVIRAEWSFKRCAFTARPHRSLAGFNREIMRFSSLVPVIYTARNARQRANYQRSSGILNA